MNHIYHTEGIILGSKDFGETSKTYIVLTKDFGMIYASARGVRKMSSRLRFILQDLTYVKIDLVQGKNFWRVTSASKTNKLESICKNRHTFLIATNIGKLLIRLLTGTEKNEALFTELLNGFLFLEKEKREENYSNIEAVLVLRILHDLGYIGNHEVLQEFIETPFEEELVFAAAQARTGILKHINKALKETHL